MVSYYTKTPTLIPHLCLRHLQHVPTFISRLLATVDLCKVKEGVCNAPVIELTEHSLSFGLICFLPRILPFLTVPYLDSYSVYKPACIVESSSVKSTLLVSLSVHGLTLRVTSLTAQRHIFLRAHQLYLLNSLLNL